MQASTSKFKESGSITDDDEEFSPHMLLSEVIINEETEDTVDASQSKANKEKKIERSKDQQKDELVCQMCDKVFRFLSKYTMHMRIHTGEKPFSCDVCDKRFTRKNYVRTHMMTHTGDRPYTCDECKNTFISIQNLKKHIKHVHAKSRPHACNMCEKAFVTHDQLKLHIRVHTKDGAICLICNKVLSQNSGLRKHIKLVHNREKNHICTFCGMACCSISDLRLHTRTHTNEKPFVCDTCTKGFTRASELKRHIKTIHNKERYECSHCDKSYADKRSLKKHCDKDHLITENEIKEKVS